MKLTSCHPSDALNLEVAAKFLENLYIPGGTYNSDCSILDHLWYKDYCYTHSPLICLSHGLKIISPFFLRS